MTIQSFQLDPNAVVYTDDEIVGKVNTATANITRASSVSAAARPIAAGEVGATELAGEEFLTAEKTKLTAIEADATADQSGAEIKTAYEAELNAYTDTLNTKLVGIDEGATDDQTGVEMRDAIVTIADTDRKIVITNPLTGEFKVTAIQRDATGKLDIDYDNVATT